MFGNVLIVQKNDKKVKGEKMKTEKNIFIAFILNLLFSVIEMVGGVFTGSIAVISDAIHDFGDALSIGMACLFEKVSKKQPDKTYTFGYGRFSVLSGLITVLILVVGSCIVIYNAVMRFISPVIIDYDSMLILAFVGLIINLFAVYFTHGGHSINQKAVNLHMLEDAFGWIMIFIGAIIMRFTNFYLLDPILSIIVATFVLFHAFKQLKEILDILLIKKPKNVDLEEIKSHILEIDGVISVHHEHVWSIDGENVYASFHVVVEVYSSKIKNQIKKELFKHGVSHVTIEMETVSEDCLEKECFIKSEVKPCKHHHH